MSGDANGPNANIEIMRGDVLKFELNVAGHPFRIKTVKGIGQENDVSSGISGIGQGKVSGVLRWDTSQIEEGTYYYQCEYHPAMVGKIVVSKGKILFRM